jgi:hypothetical protein
MVAEIVVFENGPVLLFGFGVRGVFASLLLFLERGRKGCTLHLLSKRFRHLLAGGSLHSSTGFNCKVDDACWIFRRESNARVALQSLLTTR